MLNLDFAFEWDVCSCKLWGVILLYCWGGKVIKWLYAYLPLPHSDNVYSSSPTRHADRIQPRLGAFLLSHLDVATSYMVQLLLSHAFVSE